MGRPRKNGRLSCGSNQLGLDTKPRGKGVNDLYEKHAIQVSPQLASDRVLGRRKEQCNPNFSGLHVLRTTLWGNYIDLRRIAVASPRTEHLGTSLT
jgi:hypothetical protein